MKKGILKILKWTLLLAYLIGMLSFINTKHDSLVCISLNIIIDEPHKFVDSASVNKMLISNNIQTDSCNIDNLNFDSIEKIIESNPSVKNAEVYSDYNGVLNIKVQQRNPVMRIITKENESYYIDEDCSLMPISDNYTANVTIFSGEISEQFLHSDKMSNVSTNQESYPFTLVELFDFAQFINGHELWKNQIEQIYITENKEFELIPRVGNHIIILGSLEEFKFKLGKLEALYKKGFALTDWNIYKSINLKYSNQVICKKR